MSTRDRTLPRFAVGSRVRVKRNVISPYYPGVSLAGWLGDVSQVSGINYLIHWNAATLAAVHLSYRQQSERDGVDLDASWLLESEIEADPGEPLSVEQTSGKMARPPRL
jgi:hypothetical protein